MTSNCKILQMQNQPKVRFVVPAAAAILLTFGRGGLFPIEGVYTLFDDLMSIFVVIVAPVFAFKGIFPHPLNRNLHLLIPLFFLISWVSVCVLFGSLAEHGKSYSTIINVCLPMFMVSQITRFELRRLRHCILLLSGIFSLYTLLFGRTTLSLIFNGFNNVRLGKEVAAGNVILFPRIMSILIITCIISMLIEKKRWVKIYSVVIMIIPILITFATGARGPLVGLIVAVLTFLFLLRNKLIKKFYAFLLIGVVTIICYYTIMSLFPNFQGRMKQTDISSGRYLIWQTVLNRDITFFGTGFEQEYPHNIFLEMFYFYGIIGFIFFMFVLMVSVMTAFKYYNKTNDIESLWAISLLVLQIIAHQFSMEIFYGALWAAIILPLGFGWNCSSVYDRNNLRNSGMTQSNE